MQACTKRFMALFQLYTGRVGTRHASCKKHDPNSPEKLNIIIHQHESYICS